MDKATVCVRNSSNDNCEDGKIKCRVIGSNQESITDNGNVSYRLSASTSYCSSLSSESDLSFSLAVDREVDAFVSRIDSDELPAFEIRLISPLGRSPSPIDSPIPSDENTPTRMTGDPLSPSYRHNNPDYVALQDINAQINPPNDLSNTNTLETIFEGVFLNTPTRRRFSHQNSNRSRSHLLEKVALNRLQASKENHSPVRGGTSPQRASSGNKK